MQILRSPEELVGFLKDVDCTSGCFADTSFLYAAAYTDDRLYTRALETAELLTDEEIPLYANVISRMEFVDLILRKQLTSACVALFSELERDPENTEVFNLLKNIRDQNTAAVRAKTSYKINETQIKKLRTLIVDSTTGTDWKGLCEKYTGKFLLSEWKMTEGDLGLNFLEIIEGDTSDIFKEPLRWEDMVQIMGKHGMRGPDAMILNFFLKSRFPLLITGDGDFESIIGDYKAPGKAILFL